MTIFETKRLAEILGIVSRCANKTILPIYTQVKFECKENDCIISATNGDVLGEMTCKFTGDGTKFCTDAGMITRIISTLKSSSVHIDAVNEPEGSCVIIKDDKKKKEFVLPYMNPDEFIEFPVGELIGRREVGLGDFTESMNQVIPFLSKFDIRAAFNYIFLVSQEDRVTVFATDASAFSMRTIDARGNGFENSLILPQVAGILTSLGKGLIAIYETERHTIFEGLGLKLTMTKAGVKAPSLLDKIKVYEHHNHIRVNTSEIKDTINRIGSFKNDSNFATVILDVKGEKLTISSGDNSMGASAVEELDVENNGVEDVTIGFNHKVFNRCISPYQEDYIDLHMTKPNMAIIVRGIDNDIKNIVMPIMI